MILELASDRLGLRLDSERGGRITSIRGPSGREWLAESSDAAPVAWGASFVRSGMGGWDEVVPSVAATRLTGGAEVPDHGDVWSAAWKVHAYSDTDATVGVDLKSLPVRLVRTVSVAASTVRLRYRATTESSLAIPFAWSAHPQFAAEDGSVVALSAAGAGVQPQLVREYPAPRGPIVLPGVGVIGHLAERTSLKVFVEPGSLVDAATLTHPDGDALMLRWNAAVVPYLGLFWDRGEFASGSVIAVEPATAFGDDAAEAEASGRIAWLTASAPLEWQLELCIGGV